MKIKAVVFDLDDTLYPEYNYVLSGFEAVGKEVEKLYGLKNATAKMTELFNADKQNVFNRLLDGFGIVYGKTDILHLAEIYRMHFPNIALSQEVKDTLVKLKQSGFMAGIITDGRPEQQKLKIKALGLKNLIDKIIITDELGGVEYRKPCPKAFIEMSEKFNVSFEEMVYVGDNPSKDFVVKKFLPIKTVEFISNGLYCGGGYAENILPDKTLRHIGDLFSVLSEL